MINADMRIYDYYTLGKDNGYGQAAISTEPQGQIKIAINITSQSIQDNIVYKKAEYIGLTQEEIDDTCIIVYDNEFLKVTYVNPKGRYKQVYLAKYV